MTDRITAVVAVLEEEHLLAERMAGVAEAQRVAVIEGDTEALAPLTRELESMARAFSRLESQRMSVVAGLTDEDPSDVTLQAIAAGAEPSVQRQFERLRADLRSALSRLRRVTDLNSTLLSSALQINDQQMRLIRASHPRTYAATGAVVDQSFISRAWSA